MRLPARMLLPQMAIFLAVLFAATSVFADIDLGGGPPPPPGETATITVRDGATIISVGSANILSGTVSLTPTAGGASHDIPADSVLAILNTIDAATTTFAISDLQYYSSFGSFFLNCITAPADPASPLCGSWQYIVNGSDPGVGMDVKTLSNNDVVYVYFGNYRRVMLSSASVTPGQSFTATAQIYDPAGDSYSSTAGVTIGIKLGSTEVASAAVNASGNASFTLNTAGSYAVGIKEDYYYPTAQLTVGAASAAGGGGGILSPRQFDVPLAIAYLSSKQRANGSFPSMLLSDWVAIALGGQNNGETKVRLRNYLASATTSFTNVTDHERHAMALLALGINPYDAAGTDYIAHIVGAFDGKQFGDSSLVNDDIFALFPLLHAGYRESDEMIRGSAAFIISKQLSNGSWENSVDLTAAAIQALSLTKSATGAPEATSKARGFLKSKQRANGGFGDEFSTSWALQAIAALHEPAMSWIPGTLNPKDYLGNLQMNDGSVGLALNSEQSFIWATAYAIPAIEGRTWDSLLSTFQKPVPAGQAAIPAATRKTVTPAAPNAPIPQKISEPVTKPKSVSDAVMENPDPIKATSAVQPEEAVRPVRSIASNGATSAPAKLALEQSPPVKITISARKIDWTFLIYLLMIAAAIGLAMSSHSILRTWLNRNRK